MAETAYEDYDEEGVPSEQDELDRLGLLIAGDRSIAIEGRANIGIDEEWDEDEEYYEGIDDANRQEMKARTGKPLGQQEPSDEDGDRGSTVFMNITRPYVDSSSARVGDMLLPTDDRNWAIEPTPLPEYIDIAEGKLSTELKDAIKKEYGENDPRGAFEKMKEVMVEVESSLARAKDAAKRATQKIWDWHIESKYHYHNRRVIEDAAKVGTGILKGPIPEEAEKLGWFEGKLVRRKSIKPVSRRVNYRNFYPDPACGESIHDGDFTFERDDITRRGLRKLIGAPGYIEDQIRKCIAEGPMEATKEFKVEGTHPGLRAASDPRKNMFEIWYMYGSIRKEDLNNIELLSGKQEFTHTDDEHVDVLVTMVNNRVLKAALTHLEDDSFPYDLMVWQRRVGVPWGIGVARQVRPAQRVIVGAIRHMMDNAGIAGGPMLFMNNYLIQPAEGVAEIKPWKVYVAGPGYEPGMDVREAVQFIEAPMMQPELEAIVNLGLKFAEDITGLPLIMQGQTNQRTPQTVGGMQMQNNNSSTVLRRIVRNYDDMVTEPHLGRYYSYLLIYGEDPSEKGDFSVHAIGSSSLVERDIQAQGMMDLFDRSLNPLFGIDPKKLMEEMYKAAKLDIRRVQYDDEEWEQIVGQMSQPEPDPKEAIAQLKAQTEQQILAAEQAWQTGENDKDRALKMGLDEMSKEFDIYLEEMSQEGQSMRSAEKLKASLAETMQKLRVQMSVTREHENTEILKSEAEPPGRAENGKGFTQ